MERGFFSPPDGSYPILIPDFWKNSREEEPRTDLQSLSDEELISLGWKGPYEMPPFPGTSFYTHDYEWNNETRSFDVIELEEYVKISRINYKMFWDVFIDTKAYLKIKNFSKQSLAINSTVTEFIALLSDAKNNNPNQYKIQEILDEIVENISFDEEEIAEIEKIFFESGLYVIYTLNIN